MICTLNGQTGELRWVDVIRAGRVWMKGAIFQGGSAACFLVTEAHGQRPVVQMLFSLS